MAKLAIVTCSKLPEPDPDETLLMSSLAEAGVDATLAAWDDTAVDWSSFELAVIRSTWDYPEQPEAFKKWLSVASSKTTLLNPADVVAANVNKRYLQEMAEKGVDVIPSVFLDPSTTEFNSKHLEGTWFVVKPAISAGSWMCRKFGPDQFEEGIQYALNHSLRRDMMIQPYLDSVERGGEVAWIWIDGEVTHGVRKSPRFEDDEEAVSEAVVPADEDKQRVAEIIAKVDADLLYARADLIEHEGKWLLSELELIEPSLFFKQNQPALDRFISAVKTRLG